MKLTLRTKKNPEGCIKGCRHGEGFCKDGCSCFECAQFDNYRSAGYPEVDSPEIEMWAEVVGLLGPEAPPNINLVAVVDRPPIPYFGGEA